MKRKIAALVAIVALTTSSDADTVRLGGGASFSGGGTITGPIAAAAANNCAAVPYSFTGDTDTGLCSTAADTFTIFTGGVQGGSLTSGTTTFGATATRFGIVNSTGLALRSNSQIGWSASATDAGGAAATILNSEAAAIVQMGSDVNGAAVAQTFKSHDGITGTDIAGANLTVAAGRGTGAGAPGDLILQTGSPLATGTTAQTLTSRQHIESGLRTLTDASATVVFTVTTGNDLSCGGTMFFTVEAADAANQQATSGSVNFAAADNAAGDGGEACAAAVTGTNAAAATSGTLTVTADAADGGADLCNIRLTATGSLTETVGPRVRYSVVMNPTSSSCAITPQ